MKRATFLLNTLFVFGLTAQIWAQQADISTDAAMFSPILEEQIKELKDNHYVKLFKEARTKKLQKPHMPIYHYTSPVKYTWDPTGLSFYKGRWHVFYQSNLPEEKHGDPVHWGHAVSSDLVYWKDLPFAISPGPEKTCFSGGVLVDGDKAIAVYYGGDPGIMLAESSDPLLLNWEKPEFNPIIPLAVKHKGETYYGSPWPNRWWFGGDQMKIDIDNQFVATGDPCIWKQGGYFYVLVSKTRELPSGKTISGNRLFRSKNLSEWEFMHQFYENDRFGTVGDDGACPNFWPIGKDKHILLRFSHMSGPNYLLGTYDTEKQKFFVEQGGRLCSFGGATSGGAIHAPSAYPDGKGNVIALFSMAIGPGVYTLPRRLFINDRGELGQEPIEALKKLRGSKISVSEMTLKANKEYVLENIKGNTMEIDMEFTTDSPAIEIKVLRSSDEKEYTSIVFYKETGMFYVKYNNARGREGFGQTGERDSVISIDSSNSTLYGHRGIRPPELFPIYIEKDGTLNLRIFIDKSMVEVFANSQQVPTLQVFPKNYKESIGVSVKSIGFDTKMIKCDAWEMKNIN